MKKLFICASVMGLAAGVVYWLLKKEKPTTAAPETAEETKAVSLPCTQEEENCQSPCVEEEIEQAKVEAAQAVYERHAEANTIMKDAYSNIMEDFVKDFSDKKEEVVVDSESVSVMKDLDSISDELDNLLN